ncbi:MAG: hypothetical protein C4K60_16145 [Ideonella sp. MAG2]|nr:MAG: hypothetical protein C4K60_16145 [Ideonella sp. MAG2]
MSTEHFARFTLLRPARELWCDGQKVALQPHAFELLLYLMDHADRVVPKAELLAQVWGTVQVPDSVLARAVMDLRRALGEDEHDPAIVRTEPGVGYRFVAEVAAPAAPAAPTPTPSAAVGAPAPQAPPLALGLLPLSNDTGDAALAWTVHGLPALIGHLLSFQGQSRWVDAQQIGSADRATLPLPQRCQRLRDLLGLSDVVALRLVRGAHGALALELTVDRVSGAASLGRVEGRDVAELAREAAQWLSLFSCATPATEDLPPAVLELLARATHAVRDCHYRKAHSMLQEAVSLAPQSALVHVELADVLRLLTSAREARQAAAEALALAERTDDVVLQVRARYVQACVAQFSGDMENARRWVDEGRGLAMSLQGSVWPSRWVLLSGSVAHFQKDLALASQEMALAVELAVSCKNLMQEIQARLFWVGVLRDRGQIKQATSALEKARHLVQRTNHAMLEGRLKLGETSLLLVRKRFFWGINSPCNASPCWSNCGWTKRSMVCAPLTR